jgi:hypothetical protein
MKLVCRIEAPAWPQGREGQREVAAIARLIVTAESEDTIASPGNREPNYIAVSITDRAGDAVSGLTAAEVTVIDIVVAPGGGGVRVTNVSPRQLPEFYIVFVTPNEPQTWKSGVYIFGVLVERGGDRGQALAKVSMD